MLPWEVTQVLAPERESPVALNIQLQVMSIYSRHAHMLISYMVMCPLMENLTLVWL